MNRTKYRVTMFTQGKRGLKRALGWRPFLTPKQRKTPKWSPVGDVKCAIQKSKADLQVEPGVVRVSNTKGSYIYPIYKNKYIKFF